MSGMMWNQVVACLLALVAVAFAQVEPSNSTTDIASYTNLPVFFVSQAAQQSVPQFSIGLVDFSGFSRRSFLDTSFQGRLVSVNANNVNTLRDSDVCYVSCDPEDYNGELNATNVLTLIASSRQSVGIIMYSSRSNHCVVNLQPSTPILPPLWTTLNPALAGQVASYAFTEADQAFVNIMPDQNSYTNTSATSNGSVPSSAFSPSPTTAIAMVILYSITGIITALFVVIIVTGAIRAHRHPERYGPRNIVGRGRQSRARGLARAMLETLPIVKFGDHEDDPSKRGAATVASDIEMNNNTTVVNEIDPAANKSATETVTADKSAAAVTTVVRSPSEYEGDEPSASSSNLRPAIGAASEITAGEGAKDDADNSLSCSICTEDFQRGEEVRVLPCNHKFHPECVDPWLLNVSGTCPLCRIDLRPADSENDDDNNPNGVPPLVGMGGSAGHGSSTLSSLRAIAAASGSLTREERIAALRRLRQERRRNRSSVSEGIIQLDPQSEEERRGLARRFRERFRVRTMRQSQDADGPVRSLSTTEASDAAQVRAQARFLGGR